MFLNILSAKVFNIGVYVKNKGNKMEEFEKRTLWTRFKTFTRECARVLRITKKPTKEEYKTISKIAGLGILIIGAIGFIIHVVIVLITQ